MENSENNRPVKKKNNFTNRFNHSNNSESKPIGYPAKLVLNSIIILLFVKLYFIFNSGSMQLLPAYLASLIQDSTVMIINYFFFSLIFFIGVFKDTVKTFFYTIHFLIFFTSIIYTNFLQDIINYPINIFTIKFDLIFFFFKNFVNLENFIITLLVIGFTLIVSKFFPTDETLQKKVKYFFIIILILFLPTLFKPSLNPILYSGFESSKNFMQTSEYDGRINHLSTKANASISKDNFNFIDKRLAPEDMETFDFTNSKYDKILIFVVETQNYEDITKENDIGATFEKSGFNCEKYTNYYSTNLDSYTSLISILNSILVPYPAYASKNDFSFINNKTNLVELFSENEYNSIFISAYNENPYIPDKNYWNQTLDRKDFNESNFLCLDISRIDSACEDKIAISTIINEIQSSSKLFLMHEMVYGHLAKWEEKTKIKPIDYYNSFFEKFLTKLKETNDYSNTLIIVVADHGKREDSMDVDNYHIPLYTCSEDMEKKENNQFLSHINFKDIILEKINVKTAENKLDNKLFVVGSSNVWTYGLIQYNDTAINSTNISYIFINDKTLKVKTNTNETNATNIVKFNNDFNEYLNYFNEIKK